MKNITLFEPQPDLKELPVLFPDPFGHTPHPIAQRAALLLQQKLTTQTQLQHQFHDQGGGKMFGVLVVRDCLNRFGYLSAFSGKLAGQWSLAGFVPPIFDEKAQNSFLPGGEAELDELTDKIQSYKQGEELASARTRLSELLQQRDIELVHLKQIHVDRKFKRKLTRQSLPLFDQDIMLNNLSFESQHDKQEWKAKVKCWRDRIDQAEIVLTAVINQIESLKKQRSRLSRDLQKRVFATYKLSNDLGEKLTLAELFAPSFPSAGTGDCAGPKLLQYALKKGLKAVALAEFWWGQAPEGSVRHHGHYYPACRGKCLPILPFMLRGYCLENRSLPGSNYIDSGSLQIVHQDDELLVINKPAGLLSVPGKDIQDSVLTRVQKLFPSATGPLLVHRLDLATSGLLLVALSAVSHKALQKQFEQRQVVKRYVAVLSNRLSHTSTNKGTISLPLRVDLDDRPRQLVCYKYGKPATTLWELVKKTDNTTRVHFYPVTGRTHQLRLHASHKDGLNSPIVGDTLYGSSADRLMLHAEKLIFTHPGNGKRMEIEIPAPF